MGWLSWNWCLSISFVDINVAVWAIRADPTDWPQLRQARYCPSSWFWRCLRKLIWCHSPHILLQRSKSLSLLPRWSLGMHRPSAGTPRHNFWLSISNTISLHSVQQKSFWLILKPLFSAPPCSISRRPFIRLGSIHFVPYPHSCSCFRIDSLVGSPECVWTSNLHFPTTTYALPKISAHR